MLEPEVATPSRRPEIKRGRSNVREGGWKPWGAGGGGQEGRRGGLMTKSPYRHPNSVMRGGRGGHSQVQSYLSYLAACAVRAGLKRAENITCVTHIFTTSPRDRCFCGYGWGESAGKPTARRD